MASATQQPPPASAVTVAVDPPADGRRFDLLGLRSRAPWWFLLPGMALYTFVVLVPSVRGVLLAFTDWNGINPTYSYTGFENFSKLWDTPLVSDAIVRTVVIAVAVMVVQNLIGLALALGVNSNIKSRNVLRVFLFAPAVLTPVVVAYLWRNILAPDGALNALFGALGLDGLEQDWLGDSTYAMWSIVFIVVWQFAGYSMVIFLAGLQSIPREIYEAAEVDGASRWSRFWHIERPLLAPAITINLMLSIIGGIKLFDQIYATTNGGPANATQNLSTLIYRYAFNSGQFSFAIAMAVVLTILVSIFAFGQFAVLRRQEKKVAA